MWRKGWLALIQQGWETFTDDMFHLHHKQYGWIHQADLKEGHLNIRWAPRWESKEVLRVKGREKQQMSGTV